MTRDTTLRRSKRFQPSVSHPRESSTVDASWSGDPIHVRPTVHDDLFDFELPQWGKHDEDTDDRHIESAFYAAFSKRVAVARRYERKGRRRAGGKAGKEAQQFKIGDTVLIDTGNGSRMPSIGVIMAMWETRGFEGGDQDEGEDEEDEDEEGKRMKVKIHWFLRPTELAGIRAKRDHVENEIYYTLSSTAILSPSVILSHCTVSSNPPAAAEIKSAIAWSVSPSKHSNHRRDDIDDEDNDTETYFCHLAVDSQRGLFYDFGWEEHLENALAEPLGPEGEWGSGSTWNIDVDDSSSSPAKKTPVRSVKVLVDSESESESCCTEDEYEGTDDRDELTETSVDDEYDSPKTPSKKRKRRTTSPTKTPRKPRRTIAHPTPHSKAALRHRRRSQPTTPRKSPMKVRPPPPLAHRSLQLEKLPKDPWLRAMHLLHVGSRPDELPCREEEYAKVLRSVEELVDEGSGGCVYISGVPGTGKTATVHAMVRELKRMAEQNETNPFTYVEINGLRIPEPPAAYALLWEAISGHDNTRDGQLKISNKEALKNLTKHFGGVGRGPGGHACVVLMDELDQLVTAKQDVVYNFFNWPTIVGSRLVVIAVANTMDLPERVMTGRVRSRLGMVRINFQPYSTPQLEKIVHARLASAKEGLEKDGEKVTDVIAPDGVKFAAMKVSSISGDARRVLDICRRTVELVQPHRRTARTEDVKEVIKVMQNSPTTAYLRECSFHERIMLAALIKVIKREGVEEVKWGDVQRQHLSYVPILADVSSFKPSPVELNLVLDSLLASRAILIEDGLAATRKSEGERRLVLNLEQREVESVLGEVGGTKWKNALN